MEGKNKNFTNIKVSKLDNSEIEIAGEIVAERMKDLQTKALKQLSKKIEIKGFRKGFVPEDVAEKHLGKMAILEEAAEMAISEEYPNILIDEKISPLGRPEITITKIAEGNPLEFKIKTAVMPEIELADYKKIAKSEMSKKEENLEVTEKEIDDVLTEVRKNKARADKLKENKSWEENTENAENKKEEELPLLTDEFAKSLGGFTDVSDLKNKIKENIQSDKQTKTRDKKRLATVDEVISKSKISLPEILVKSELEKMTAQFKDEIGGSGIKFEDYLKHIKKSEEDLKKDWRETAEKRAKLQLILNKIAVEEKIFPDGETVKKEVDHILEHYKEADPERAKIYVETMLTNEKVFQFLEEQR